MPCLCDSTVNCLRTGLRDREAIHSSSEEYRMASKHDFPTEELINLGQVTFPLCALVSLTCRMDNDSACLQGLQ